MGINLLKICDLMFLNKFFNIFGKTLFSLKIKKKIDLPLDKHWFSKTLTIQSSFPPKCSPRTIDEHRARLIATYLHRDTPTAFPHLKLFYERAMTYIRKDGSKSFPVIVQELSHQKPIYFDFIVNSTHQNLLLYIQEDYKPSALVTKK